MFLFRWAYHLTPDQADDLPAWEADLLLARARELFASRVGGVVPGAADGVVVTGDVIDGTHWDPAAQEL